jgi:hypothetical protein
LPETWCEQLERALNSKQLIPCAAQFKEIPEVVFHAQLDVMLVERLEQRVKKIDALYEACDQDWDECLHRFLASFMGRKINNEAMEVLARSIPIKIIYKHRSSLMDIEALLFGQGGFLETDQDDEYAQTLQVRYLYLAHKYQLVQMPGIAHRWQYKGVRPAGFPERCIAQWAYLLFCHDRLLHWALDATPENLLSTLLDAGLYWKEHYRFGKHFPKSGKQRARKKNAEQLVMNAIIPFRIAYKKHLEQFDVGTYLSYYEALKAEENKVVSCFRTLGYPVKSARDTQALLQLYNNYCNYRKCLSCKAGHYLIKKEGLI